MRLARFFGAIFMEKLINLTLLGDIRQFFEYKSCFFHKFPHFNDIYKVFLGLISHKINLDKAGLEFFI